MQLQGMVWNGAVVVLTMLFVFVNLGRCSGQPRLPGCGLNAADIPKYKKCDAVESFWATDELQQIETEW